MWPLADISNYPDQCPLSGVKVDSTKHAEAYDSVLGFLLNK